MKYSTIKLEVKELYRVKKVQNLHFYGRKIPQKFEMEIWGGGISADKFC